ncbi:TetR/AcrR family transcriptional regulator [Streptomyces olivoreticuli]|uniref:HTH-type transcriptional regulator MtrR n=1 Tax=Streptomyces blastmyceticus TaxID=68180 RepID=A0A077K9E8_9ACTN|nr:TetR/AcrR family transcriptional regulator [Streptomyces olivoreticuli]WKK20895.1 TetR/AcrR family transcriptional regulator [Streptomyces olivoreticuli]BAP27954.1 HTH-type transcriptional regulator MtrR [Streptomyces blastmyceticus]
MGSTPQARRSDTRERIQKTALDLFVSRGYEKTSLREIAEELGVTKAALYYHFKTKEDILTAISEDLGRPVDELIAWAEEQPPTLDTRRELMTRYSAALKSAMPIYHILQENQATLRDLAVGRTLRNRVEAISRLMHTGDADFDTHIRVASALLTVHFGAFTLDRLGGTDEEKRQALLKVALETIGAPAGQSG